MPVRCGGRGAGFNRRRVRDRFRQGLCGWAAGRRRAEPEAPAGVAARAAVTCAAAAGEAAVGAAGVCAAGKLPADEAADAAPDWGGVESSAFAGALLVVRSTVTLRIGSGAAAGRAGAGAAVGFGPDNNSGTMSTTIATRIDAPISRSLTRRSISWVSKGWAAKYIRDAPPAAAILGTRASRSPARRCEKIRTRRFGPGAPRHLRPRTGARDAFRGNDGPSHLLLHHLGQRRPAAAAHAVDRGAPP